MYCGVQNDAGAAGRYPRTATTTFSMALDGQRIINLHVHPGPKFFYVVHDT
jgi:hypothetical protein